MKDLQEWMQENEPDEALYAKGAWWSQCLFVRDTLSYMLTRRPIERETPRATVSVVNTHTSKSTVCPVYQIETHWATITMRYNFHDWNVSIESKVGELPAVPGLTASYNYCFFQGMDDYRFPSMDEGRERFSFCVGDHYTLYAALWFWARTAELEAVASIPVTVTTGTALRLRIRELAVLARQLRKEGKGEGQEHYAYVQETAAALTELQLLGEATADRAELALAYVSGVDVPS